jgi:DNA gyrase subunit A
MSNSAQNINIRLIEDEMSESYLNYSMSVITSRALPDVRDGLKPVNRRVLFGMNDLGLQHNKTFRKSARIVGEVLGKYHPHGDSSVYMAMVRMAQDFSLRYPLVKGQGNFGSVDGDSPAAMRYTEAKMSKIAQEILRDLEKETVDFRENFDDTLKEPIVFPTVLPNLLINGSSGIAVGMATNIPPHNLTEVVNACLSFIDSYDQQNDSFPISISELATHVKGPDFPLGGIITGTKGIRDAYETGRGKIIVRGKVNIETKGKKTSLIITEIPYQLNKTNLIDKIVDLIKDKKIEGISDLNDESDRDGMRINVSLKRDADPHVVLNLLYKYTQLQQTFGANMLALVDGQPKICNLYDLIWNFIKHRHEVVERRTKYEHRKAKEREHILLGLKIALDNIDEVIKIIRASKDPVQARTELMDKFGLSEIQARAILDMRLQRLTGLERDKIEQELKDIQALIVELEGILASKVKRYQIVRDELEELPGKYDKEGRRTEIIENFEELTIEDMIAEEDMVITISNSGMIKRYPVSTVRKQNRGGRGKASTTTKDEEYVEHLFIASTHEYMMFFTDKGRCYWLKVYEIPQMSRTARGRSILSLIAIEKDEKVQAFVKVRDFSEDHNIVMATRSGTVKKTPLSAYGNIRKNGINAITIKDGDKLVDAKITNGSNQIVLGTSHGFAIRFDESDARPMGRTAAGVRGIRLRGDDFVVGMVVIRNNAGTILAVAENGYGKRTDIDAYRLAKRGGMGVITIKGSERNGKMLSIMGVGDEEDLVLITEKGVINRQHVKTISIVGRNTQGVRLIKLDDGDILSAVARVPKDDSAESIDPETGKVLLTDSENTTDNNTENDI